MEYMKKKKILQVLSCLEYGGTEAYIVNNLKNINKEEFNFDLWIAQPSDSMYVSSKYVNEIISLGGNIYYGEILQSKLKFMKNLYDNIKKNGPYDAIHAHMNLANAWVMLIAFLVGIKIRISHSHDTAGKEAKSLIKKIYFRFLEYIIKFFATKKLSCSREAGNYLYGEDYFLKYGEVCNNGIDVKKFLNIQDCMVDALKSEFNIPEDSFIIGNISRFEPKKNTSFTVGVFNEILKINPKSILILGGVDGGQLSYIKEKVHTLGIENSVRFIGIRNDINICLHLINAYIFPSLYEGLPIVLLEAQAANLPCFASSGVSKEVDMKLNLVHFLDLDKGEKFWADYIMNKYNKTKLNQTAILDAFNQTGYSIKSSVKKIEKIYNGE